MCDWQIHDRGSPCNRPKTTAVLRGAQRSAAERAEQWGSGCSNCGGARATAKAKAQGITCTGIWQNFDGCTAAGAGCAGNAAGCKTNIVGCRARNNNESGPCPWRRAASSGCDLPKLSFVNQASCRQPPCLCRPLSARRRHWSTGTL